MEDLERLLTDLSSRDISIHLSARQALIDLGDSVVDLLVDRLADEDIKLVASIVVILGEITNPRSFQSLINCLEHPHTLVQMQAATALGRFASKDSVSKLIDYLPHSAGLVEQSILNVLIKNATVEVLPQMLDFLHTTPSNVARYMTIRVLANIGNKDLISDLEKYLDDENHHVRNDARIAIDKLRDEIESEE